MIVIVRILVEILLFKGRAKMKTFLLSAVIMTSAFSAHAVFDASSLRLKVYKMAVSSSPDCSNPTVVVSNSSPSYTNFKTNPTLGSGNVADGNYPCVIIEFSDNIKITPSGNGSHCFSSTETTNDVCRTSDWNGDGDTTDPGETTTSTLIDGSTVTCDSGDNRVAMYLTTAASATTQSDAFNPPNCNTAGCDPDTGFNLARELQVSGSAVGKFIVDTDGKVCDGDEGGDLNSNGCSDEQAGGNVCACEQDSQCNMLPPNFSFSQI
jgi:hypothetical protein